MILFSTYKTITAPSPSAPSTAWTLNICPPDVGVAEAPVAVSVVAAAAAVSDAAPAVEVAELPPLSPVLVGLLSP